ncbi:Big [Melia azedarach]|uniref:Big n=1 Tax=Melia azedarach TaxID=155640 RepID=A0ACC1XSG7_MELAZ|nr:Big [Melia azedarach]
MNNKFYQSYAVESKIGKNKSLLKMKGKESVVAKTELSVPPPPPPPMPFWVQKTTAESITNQEIARFWRQKRIDEEDHLLAAIKAAARIRARNLSEENYKQFEESLKNDDDDTKENNVPAATKTNQNKNNNELRVGIKDWWTKSKYAYLNQPAIGSMENPKKRSSSYTPNCFTYKPVSLCPASLGVF